jgi:hypothetical protein
MYVVAIYDMRLKENREVLVKNSIAISKGLPEFEGHYGFDHDTMEFNKPTE